MHHRIDRLARRLPALRLTLLALLALRLTLMLALPRLPALWRTATVAAIGVLAAALTAVAPVRPLTRVCTALCSLACPFMRGALPVARRAAALAVRLLRGRTVFTSASFGAATLGPGVRGAAIRGAAIRGAAVRGAAVRAAAASRRWLRTLSLGLPLRLFYIASLLCELLLQLSQLFETHSMSCKSDPRFYQPRVTHRCAPVIYAIFGVAQRAFERAAPALNSR
jgi:hypothetical protein